MIILGINEDHNATAAILEDGRVLACASEERFTRIKNDTEYPRKAIDSVLELTGINPSQIDYVAFAGIYSDPAQLKIKRITRYKISDYVREMHEHWEKVLLYKQDSDYFDKIMHDARFAGNGDNHYNYDFLANNPKELWGELFNMERRNTVTSHLGVAKDKIRFIDHHTGHAYYAYYASQKNPAYKAAVVTADGWGDGCNATISIIENDRVVEIHRTAMCNMARIYRWITLLLGMKPNEHEYKVMGLAPYSQDYVRDPAYKIFKETLVVEGLDFTWKVKPTDSYFYFKDKFEGLRFDGIAAGLQLWLEDLLSAWITNIMNHTGAQVLYFSGGLSMNVKANKTIAELPAIKDFYISPSGGDESLAIGAAYVLSKELGSDPVPLTNNYLGYAPSEQEAREAAKVFQNNPDFKVIESPDEDMLAELLAQGKVLGRCLGKMEFGARALGNRSILCNPSKFENLRIINEKIKFRDFWMPFTPSILIERGSDYLVNPKGLQAQYMTLAFDSTPLAREQIRAAIHPYDFTVRPQLVSADVNPGYHALIKAFERKTGIGALLNTSLNLHGSPIVCTAADAIDTLVKSGLDGMILPGILILKC